VRMRIPQPPIEPFARETERRSPWPALAVAVLAILLVGLGVDRLTNAETLTGDSAVETQVNRAFASGGIRYVDPNAVQASAPPGFEIPPWIPMDGAPKVARIPPTPSGHSPLRLDLGAKDPCPT